ncbi:MAG: glycerophosphodiester phosphodiesterase, partial [Deinococcales bacterium]
MLPGPFGTVADALTYIVGVALLLAAWRGMWRGRALPGVEHGDTLLVGHRGTRGVEPENTLAAFRRAFDEGLDGVEFDVQRSLDGA